MITREECRNRLDLLTQREWQVLARVMEGDMNKEIAHNLGIALKTVKVHRGSMMRKLGVVSVVHLVRFVDKAEIAKNSNNERPAYERARRH